MPVIKFQNDKYVISELDENGIYGEAKWSFDMKVCFTWYKDNGYIVGLLEIVNDYLVEDNNNKTELIASIWRDGIKKTTRYGIRKNGDGSLIPMEYSEEFEEPQLCAD